MPAMRTAGALILIAVCLFFQAPAAYAVVGQAEEYSLEDRESLTEFHDTIVFEEQRKQMESSENIAETLKQKKAELEQVKGEERDVLSAEIETIKRQLLQIPKRDRLKIELMGSHTFDSNVNRKPYQEEKGDSIFDSTATAYFDLSGKKTDLRFDVAGQKQWNVIFSEKDTLEMSETLRYRRRYFKKVLHSKQSRIARGYTQ